MEVQLLGQSFSFCPWNSSFGQVFASPFAIDCETGLIDEQRPWLIPPYIIGAAFDGRQGFFITREQLPAFLSSHRDLIHIFHNASFDLAVMNLVYYPNDIYGLVDRKCVADTMLLHQLLSLAEEGHTGIGGGQSSLEGCAKNYLGVELPKDLKVQDGDVVRLSYGKWNGRPPHEMYPIYLEYLAKDVIATRFVFDQLITRIQQKLANCSDSFGYVDANWLNGCVARWGFLTHHTQLKASIVLREITAVGLHIDRSRSQELSAQLEAATQDMRTHLRSFGYSPAEKGNDRSLQAILREVEAEDDAIVFPRTPTGKISTKAEDLEYLAGSVPFVELLLEYRTVDKLLGTYIKKMGKSVLHPKFNTLVSTGRTSSYGDINAQNLPRDDRVRNCFVPTPGHVFLDVDYSAIEMVTLAQTIIGQFRAPSVLGELLNRGEDPHRVIASRLLGKHPDEITKPERQKAKAINFGNPGGMGLRTLRAYARTTFKVELTEEEAEQWSETWFSEFPEMRTYLATDLDVATKITVALGLSFANLNRHTGKDFEHCMAGDSPIHMVMLGAMFLKVIGYSNPVKRSGEAYDEGTIDYFWTALERCISRFPEDVHSMIRDREASTELSRNIRNTFDRRGVFTFTGRLRGNARYNVRRNTPFQGLAADGAKIALWKLWRAGYRVANFIHDEVLIELPEDSDLTHHAENVRRIMIDAMREVVPDVHVDVEYAACNCWSKEATEVLDGQGRLIVWRST